MRLNQRGSSIVPIMIILFVFSILFGVFITRLSSQLRMNVKMRGKYEADMMKTTIQMLNAPRFACAKNLNAAGFGTTLAVLQAKSAAGNIVLLNPDVGAPAGAILLATGMRHLHLDILSLRFTPPTQVIPAENAYRADLIIDFRASNDSPNVQVQIPYYLVTDAVGNITACQSTAYTPDPITPNATLEDQMCIFNRSHGSFYRADQQFCELP